MAVVVLAALRLGLVVVNTNPMYSVRELVHQLNDANVRAVVVLDQFYPTLEERCQKPILNMWWSQEPLIYSLPSRKWSVNFW